MTKDTRYDLYLLKERLGLKFEDLRYVLGVKQRTMRYKKRFATAGQLLDVVLGLGGKLIDAEMFEVGEVIVRFDHVKVEASKI